MPRQSRPGRSTCRDRHQEYLHPRQATASSRPSASRTSPSSTRPTRCSSRTAMRCSACAKSSPSSKARGHGRRRETANGHPALGCVHGAARRPRLQGQAHRDQAGRGDLAATPSPAARALGRRRRDRDGHSRRSRCSPSRRTASTSIPVGDEAPARERGSRTARRHRSPVRRLSRRGRYRPVRGPVRSREVAASAYARHVGVDLPLEARDLILQHQLAALHRGESAAGRARDRLPADG